MPLRRSLAALGLVIFLTGWTVTVIGMGLLQSKCKDAGFFVDMGSDPNSYLAPTMGDGCRRLFRFPWFVVALCLIPVICFVLAIIKPHVGASSSAGLWSVLAALCILMTNFLYNLHDAATDQRAAALVITDDNQDGIPDSAVLVADVYAVYERRLKVALAGFALMAAGALLNILFASLLASKAHSEHSHTEGGRIDEHHHEEHKTVAVHNVNPIHSAVPVRYEEPRTVGTGRPVAVNTANMQEVHVV